MTNTHKIGQAKRMQIPDLPQDILVHILSRLPTKSLGQFKSVCKSWQSLISNSHFVKLQLNHAISDPNADKFRILTVGSFHSLYYESPASYKDFNGDDAMVELTYSLSYPKEDAEIVGSCNGLICMLYHSNSIVLWNPTTKIFRDLPQLQSFSSDDKFFYGFGYDSSIDDYKVVRAAQVDSLDETKVEVFNLKGESWRLMEGFDNQARIEQEAGIFLNGALHWQGSRIGTDSTKHEFIVFLDLATEKFKEFSKPDLGDKNGVEFHTLSNLGGCLSLLSYGNRGANVEVWTMKEHGVDAYWSKLIILGQIVFDYIDYLIPVCFTKNGDLIVDVDGNKLVRYNPKENTCRQLKHQCEDWDWTVYVESLISPMSDN